MLRRSQRAARQARKAADRLEQRIEHEAAELEAVRVQHYSGSHLIRRGGDATLCGIPLAGKRTWPADRRYDKPHMRCADLAKSLLA